MKRRKQDIILLCVSLGSFFLMSLTFLIMPITIPNIEPRILNVIIGSAFWGFLIIGVAMQVILAQRRKAWIRRNHLMHDCKSINSKVGIIAFAQNIFGGIADAILGLSLIFLITALVLTKSAGYICYIAFAMFVFAFCLHCILNGKIFYFIQNQNTFFLKQKENNIKKENERHE